MARGASDILLEGTPTKTVASSMTTEVRKEVSNRLQGETILTPGYESLAHMETSWFDFHNSAAQFVP